MKSNTCIKSNGFTLIELLLYVVVASSVLFLSTFFISTLLESRVKNQTIAEVEQQGFHIMQIITSTIQNAEDITSPSAGNTSTSLTLDVIETSDDPTVFDLDGGILRITEGSNDPIDLTNTNVTVSNLSFENNSRSDTPGVVNVSFTVERVNATGRYEYDFVKTFYAGASLRHPE